MRPMLVAAALLLAPPASAETYACSLVRTCSIGGGCTQKDGAPSMTLTVAEDGQSASLLFNRNALEMVLVDEGPAGRSFLALRPGEGIGVLTLDPDGNLAASSNDFSSGVLTGTTALGSCTAGAG